MVFGRGDYLFAFNFHPTNSHTGYAVSVPEGTYSIVLNTDSKSFGGYDQVDGSLSYSTQPTEKVATTACPTLAKLLLYLPARTALVLKRNTDK